IALLVYFFWTHFSAIIFVRWVAKKIDAPVEVVSAKWRIRPKYLLQGKIDELSFVLRHRATNTNIAIKTSVRQTLRQGETILSLNPEIKIQHFPPLEGEVEIGLGLKAVRANFKLSCAKPGSITLGKLGQNNLKVAFERCQSTGAVNTTNLLDKTKWQATVINEISNLQTLVKTTKIKINKVTSTHLFYLREAFPLPLYSTAKVLARGIRMELPAYQIEEPLLEINTQSKVTSDSIQLLDVAVSPLNFRAHGGLNFNNTTGELFYHFGDTLDKLVDQRIVPWFSVEHRQIRRMKARGQLTLSGKFTKVSDDWTHQGTLFLHGKKIEVPNVDLFAEDLVIHVPFTFPSDEDPLWGRFEVRSLEFKSVLLKKLRLFSRITEDGIEITTENSQNKDEPIRQIAWGGKIDIENLYVFRPWSGLIEINAAVFGGPFELAAIQKDLCFASKNPVPGQLYFEYPSLKQQEHDLTFKGRTRLNLFGGTAELGNIDFSLSGDHPRLRFSFDWNDLDLAAIGSWTKIGDMRGGVEGHLRDVTLILTSLGPIPVSYDLRIRGLNRGGQKIRMYGRAINNILQLVGMERDDLPWYANVGISASTMWRNLVPATVDYAGFQAKTDGEWTEVSTFDPVGSKKHYFLYGREFTIP
ncbi:MAG TPA: hypothetical protein PLH57_09410, partial [Oligoflexia bacterium]|nr:hypothetical protein [Oligoflexia bacterium]